VISEKPFGPDVAVAIMTLIDRCYRLAGLPLRPRARVGSQPTRA
jgi:hypothetical protein